MHYFKAILVILGNAFALWLANKYVPGFILSANIWHLIFIGAILAILNFLLKPVLTLILGPVIVLTLGLGLFIVNAILLYLLTVVANHIDILHGSIIIQDIPALLLATLIVSVVNFVIHLI